jgi:ATP-dependent DNA helicase RecG
MVAVGPNMFYTVTLPCTLWFLDKGKARPPRADTVLFIDARHIYRQVDRAHRDWTPAQIGFIANLVRLYRGEALDFTLGGDEAEAKLKEVFGKKPAYADVPGLCKAATLKEIEAQGWSLNPGRYVGVAPGEEVSDEDFKEQLETLNEELETAERPGAGAGADHRLRSENEHIEFKEAKNRFDFEELVNYCVALANEGGGRMVLGVSDKPPRRVVGTRAFDVPERTVAGIYERIHLKVLWQEIQHPDGRVLVFEVPPRPVGHPLHYDGRYWMRAGEELVPMTPDQLKRIIDEGKPEFVDQSARSGCTEEDVVSLLDVQGYFDLRKRPLPSTRAEVLDTLAGKGFVRREDGTFTITNLGALLLAKRLTDFETVARKGVRLIVYDGVSKQKVRDGKDITGQKGYAVGFEGLVNYIFDQLPASEEIAAALRTTTHAYPMKAIRELIGNAIVHQDLTEQGTGITVEIYEDRIEVTNPGLPILPLDRFIDENQSRNERFADALRAYTEDQLVEQPAIGLFAALGWQTVSAMKRKPSAQAARWAARPRARWCWWNACARRWSGSTRRCRPRRSAPPSTN